MVIERVAKAAGTGIGAAAGRFISNPRVLLLAALGIGLFVFRDKISDFFAGLKFPEFPEINFPEINFPEFPTLPPLPTACSLFGIGCEDGSNGGGGGFPNLCSLFGIGCDEEQQEEEDFETSPEVTNAPDCVCGTNITQDSSGQILVTCKSCGTPPPFNDAEMFAEDFPEEFIEEPPPPDPIIPPIVVDPFLETEGEFTGGGSGFIGGSIGQTPITTLFQVLDLFGGFSASQAANFLFQFSGISPEEALNLDQFKQFQ